MALSLNNRTVFLAALVCAIATLALLLWTRPSAALPDYAAKTGQVCGTCHVNPAGGGPRTDKGKAFEAIPTHSTDPAGAWAQVSGAGAPAPAATTAPTAPTAPTTPTTPAAASTPVTVTISGATSGSTVAYSIMVRNSGDAVSNVYVAGSIPAGATFSAASTTPKGAGLLGSDGGVAAWLVDAVPAKGSIGPFVYKVSAGSAQNLAASAFAHWAAPSDGSVASASVTPISNSERLALEQAINDKLNTADNTLTLWSLVPGNGPRMVDFLRDINLTWFAGQAQNWVMAEYEIDDQFPSDINKLKLRNATLAPALTNFQSTAVAPVLAAIKAKDLNAFNTAYDNMTAACNSCHIGRDDSKSIKIVRPEAPILPGLDFAGNK